MEIPRGRPRALEIAALGCGAFVFLVAGAARPAMAQDPGGANTTIKIDGVPFDDHPDNEPKPGCTFQVDFYGFDADDLYADVVFSGQGATGDGVIETGRVVLDGDPNDGGGSEAGLDGHGDFDLAPELNAPGGGFVLGEDGRFHVRVDVAVFQSDGAGGVQEEARKSKVFKIGPCAPTPTVVVPPVTPAGPPTVESVVTPAVLSAGVTAAAPASQAQAAGVAIARTGLDNGDLALAGLGAVVAGIGLVLYGTTCGRGAARLERLT